MPKFHLVATTGLDPYWQVHKYGCADVARMVRGRDVNGVSTIECTDAKTLVTHELDLANGELREMGYSEDDFRIMPCCKDAR